MSYSVGTLWALYVISFIIFWVFVRGVQGSFFLATIASAIVVFIGTAWLDPNHLTATDKTWLSVLYMTAFLLPVFVILVVLSSKTDKLMGCI